MLKRLFTPLTLVNQLALIVLLATIIGVAGMAISARLVNGVQGSAHAINKAGSLRMQSYRLLAAIPLNENDQKLVADMTATVFSRSCKIPPAATARKSSLKPCSSTGSWRWPPGCSAQSIRRKWPRMSPTLSIVSTSWSPHSTTPPSSVSNGLVWIHRILAIGMALLLIFTIIWLRAPPAAAVETAAEHGARGESA